MKKVFYKILSAGAFFTVFYILFNIVIALSTKCQYPWEEEFFTVARDGNFLHEKIQEMDCWLMKEKSATWKQSGLLLGSSTVYINVDPHILSDKTGIDFYNAATSSQALNNSLEILKYCLGRERKVDYIFLGVNPILWSEDGTKCTTDWVLNHYRPYRPFMIKMVWQAKDFGLWKSYIYYTVKRMLIKDSSAGSNIYNDTYMGRGFMCCSETRERSVYNDLPVREQLNPIGYNALLKIISICEKEKIKLVLFVPKILNSDYDLTKIEPLKYPVIDARNAPVDTAYFFDNYHLYCKGTKPYTEWIAGEFLNLAIKQK